MEQVPKSANNQNENDSAINIPPLPAGSSLPPVSPPAAQSVSQVPPAPDNTSKSAINTNMQYNGQQFKLASAEVQGPKPPLVSGKGSKFTLILIAAILIIIFGIGGYYFYMKDNSLQPVSTPVVVIPVSTPIVDKNLDSDKDGLPDSIEKILGTYITKADTDGDGYNDLQEIKSGYSPLVIGSAGKYSPEEWDLVKGKIKIEDREFYNREFETIILSPSPTPMISSSSGPATSQTPLSFNCGTDTVKDTDNNNYNTVKIGEQCWLKENLKVTKNPAGIEITRYCYNNDPKICNTDGGLYDWNTAMNKSAKEGAQGICPNGWHVPKDSEWYVLENGLKDAGKTCDANRNSWDCDSAGTKLKVGGISGFEGILVGYRSTTGLFLNQATYTSFWSSSQSDASGVQRRYLNSGFSTIAKDNLDKMYGYSIRCLKD